MSYSLWPTHLVFTGLGLPSWTLSGHPCHHHPHWPSPLSPAFLELATLFKGYVHGDCALVEDLRGFERRLEDLLRDLRQLSVRAEVALASSVSDTRSEAWDFVSTPRPARRETPPSSSHDYNNLARELPQVPDFCVRPCANLSGYQSASGKSRAERAWEAGFWAKCALEGQIRRPRKRGTRSVTPSHHKQRLECIARRQECRSLRRSTNGPLSVSCAGEWHRGALRAVLVGRRFRRRPFLLCLCGHETERWTAASNASAVSPSQCFAEGYAKGGLHLCSWFLPQRLQRRMQERL